MLFKFYLLALAVALVTAGMFVFAGHRAGLARDYGPMPVGRGVSVPPHTEVAEAPAWLALICALVADGTLFTSLLFGTFYLWIAAPNWPAAIRPEPSLMLAVGTLRRSCGCCCGAWIAASGHRRWQGRRLDRSRRAGASRRHRRGRRANRRVSRRIRASMRSERPRRHCSSMWLCTPVSAFSSSSAISLRLGAGFIATRRVLDLRLTRLWLDYTLVTGVIAMGLVLALPALVTMLGARP